MFSALMGYRFRQIDFGVPIRSTVLAVTVLLLLSLTASAQTLPIASLTYPSNMATQVAPNVSFTWTPVNGAQVYYLYVGSAPGLKDVYNGGETTKTAATVRLTFGTNYYARLYTKINNTWQYAPDVTFATAAPATMLSPSNNSSGVQNPVQFAWSPSSGASGYYLYVGTSLGAKDIVDSGQIPATQLNRSLNPGTYYARVYTLLNAQWYASSDITFSVASLPTSAQLTSPANGATQVSPTVSFTWNPVANAQVYYLYVGSAPGLKDIYDGGQTTATSASVRLSPGKRYYARLYTEMNSQWSYAPDISFTTMLQSSLITPADGSSLNPSLPVSFAWTAIPNATGYYLYVGTSAGAKDVINTGEVTFTQLSKALPPGTYHATIYTNFGPSWYASQNISFTVASPSTLVSPPNVATNVDTVTTFSWAPITWATGYSLSVGTTPGASDGFSSGTVASTSYRNSAPLQANTTYYATVGTLQGTSWSYTSSSFTTGTGIAHLLSPANGAINIDPFSTLNWNAIADAQTYYIYVGSAFGLKDVYDSGQISGTSLAVPTLKPNTQYFIRLYTEKNSKWYSADSTFTTGNGVAQMIYPANGATNVDPAIPFGWSTDPQAIDYRLSVGSTLGAKDIYDSGDTLDTSTLVSIRAPGTYFIRLYTVRSDGRRYVDSSFTLGGFIANLTTPANKGVADPYAPFVWTPVPNTTAYYLYIGSTPGANDIFNSGQVTVNSLHVPNLVPGTNYYARLFTFRGGMWLYADSSFLAGQGVSQLTDPLPGSAISPFETFTWTPPDGSADAYYLTIGSTAGARDVFDSGAIKTTSVQPTGLDFGKSYYGTLSTLKYNVWRPVSFTFTTLDQASVPNLAQLRASFYAQIGQATAAVRMMADPSTNIAVSGSPLDQMLQQNGLTAANCFWYAKELQAQLTPRGINARLRGITLTGTSYEAHTPLEYYDPFLQKWAVADPTFGIMFFDSGSQTGQSVEEIQALVVASNYSGLRILCVTSLNDTVLRQYYLDPVTLYLNVYPPGQQLTSLQNSPTQFLNSVNIADIENQAGFYLFSFSSTNEQINVNLNQDPDDVTLAPVDGTMFSRAISVPNVWNCSGVPSNVQAYKFIRPVF